MRVFLLRTSENDRYVLEKALHDSARGGASTGIGDQVKFSSPVEHRRDREEERKHSLQVIAEVNVCQACQSGYEKDRERASVTDTVGVNVWSNI